MAVNYGKKFEAKVKTDLQRIPDSAVLRLYDTTSGYKSIANPCDFIFYKYPKMFMIEAKCKYGNTFPFTALRQYDKLVKYKGIDGLNAGVLIWFIDHDKVVWVDIEEIVKMKKDGCKSVNIKMLDEDTYKIIEIPSVKKQVFMDSDYTILTE